MDLTSKEKISISILAADDKKAEDPLILDLKKISSVTDYFIIASGNSDTQVRAIADNIIDKLSERGIEPIGREGYNDGTWVLLDYVDFVVHIFQKDKRIFYSLEDLWADAPKIEKKDLKKGKAK